MAAKERADLLRSARRKILQNSICRQRRPNRNRILQKFLSSLTPSGVGRKSRQSSTKSASMGTGRVEPEAMRALASRPAASPPVPGPARRCAFADRFVRHCLRRPSRSTTLRGCSGLPPSSQAPGIRRRGLGGTGSSCAAGPVCRGPDDGFESNVLFVIGSGFPLRAAATGKKTILLRTTSACPSGLGPQGAGFRAGGMPRRSSRRTLARNLAAGRGQARRPPDRRPVTRWRGCVRCRSYGHRPAAGRPGQHRAAFRASREGCGACVSCRASCRRRRRALRRRQDAAC